MIKHRLLLATALTGLAFGAFAAPALAKNVVTMNTVQIFGTIDPAKISDYTDYMAAVNLYDALVTVNEKGEIVPQLAASWTVSDDAKEVTYTIRDDAKFADGSPVEASDVVYSFERLLRINQGPANLFAGVLKPGSITAVDAKTVKFTLEKTFAPFLATVPAVFILNADVVKANEGTDDGQTWLATNVAGAGAYTLQSWDRGAQMVVERDPNYYGGWGANPIDEIRWIVTNDEATVKSMAASGELTMTSSAQAPDTYTSLGQNERFNIYTEPTQTVFNLKLNTKVAPTDDIHVRKAIALATDYDTILSSIFPGGALNGPLPPAFAAAYAEDLPAPKFDLEAAKAELAQSKYAGQPIKVSLAYVAGLKFEEEVALLMQANLEQIGITVEAQPEPWNRITELATKVETSPAISEIFFSPTYPSPDSMFFTQYHSSAAGTWASLEWLQDKDVDKLIDDARATGDAKAQADLYKQLQHKLVDMQADVFLLTQNEQHAIDKCLTGYSYVPMQSFQYDFHNYSWIC